MNTDTNNVAPEVTVKDEQNATPTSEGTSVTTPAKKAAAPKKASTPAKKAAPKKTATKKSAPKKASTPSKPAANAKPTAKKKTTADAKPNPSASYIGFTFSSTTPHTVNYRQGKKNIVECTAVKCTGANATGRRLNVEYTAVDGKPFVRRVYKEYFEKAAQVFGALLPE